MALNILKSDLPKIEKIDSASPERLLWVSRRINRLTRSYSLMDHRGHPIYRKIVTLRMIHSLTNNSKTFFSIFVPNIDQFLDNSRDEVLRQIIKKDQDKLNKLWNRANQLNLNEIEFLEEEINALKQEKLPQNIEDIKIRIEKSSVDVYKDIKLAKKLAKISEKTAMAEVGLLRGFISEVRAGNVDPVRIERIRREFNNVKLADSIEKLKAEIPNPNALPNLRAIGNSIAPNGANLPDFIGRYVRNPQLVIDQKTKVKFSEIVEQVYSFSYFSEVSRRITFELRGGDRGRWQFFKIFSDDRVLSAWINRLSNGYVINRGDLIAVGLQPNHWLFGRRIKDREIADRLSKLRHKTISEYANVLNEFVNTRLAVLAREALSFIGHRLIEIPQERKRAFEGIYHLLEGRLNELSKIERKIKKKIVKTLSYRYTALNFKLERTRIKWHTQTKISIDTANQEFREMRDYMKTNLTEAYQLLFAYWLKNIDQWETQSERKKKSKTKKLEKTKLDLINFVYNLDAIYSYWYNRRVLGIKEGLKEG